MKLSALADALGCPFEGDGDHEITRVASLEDGDVTADCIGFVRSEQMLPLLAASKLGCVIAFPSMDVGARNVIRSTNPGLHFARAVALVRPPPSCAPGVHPSAVLDETAEIDPTAHIGAHCVVGAGCRIGAHTTLHPRVTLYAGVEIGERCTLHAQTVVREGTRIGSRVVLQPGVVLGGDGFGYVFDEQGGWEHIPHAGIVVVEDDVEIGANSTVDRSMLGETRIGHGTKIDNLVMVAHNCEIAEHVLVAAQVGLAGSSRVERRALMMGQVGVAGHLTIGEGAFVGAKTGVHSDVKPGTRIWGYPQQEERGWARSSAAFAKLPDLIKRVRALERTLNLRKKP